MFYRRIRALLEAYFPFQRIQPNEMADGDYPSWDTATGRMVPTAAPAGKPNLVKGLTVLSPASSSEGTLFFTMTAITISQMSAVLVGSSTPSVAWTLRHASDRTATGNEVITAGSTTTNTTTGHLLLSFNDATIPASSFVWVEIGTVSGTVDEFHLSIEYTED